MTLPLSCKSRTAQPLSDDLVLVYSPFCWLHVDFHIQDDFFSTVLFRFMT